MKKTIAVISVLFLAIVLIISCGRKPAQEKKVDQEKQVNPNGSSELAIVMRTMMEHGKELKKSIEENQPLVPYPVEIKTLMTAQPTEGMIEDKDVYNGFATFHLATLDSIYLKNVEPKVQFNHMVKSCVDCHENYCHGPIPTIKKLYISSK